LINRRDLRVCGRHFVMARPVWREMNRLRPFSGLV
jgi:hypothetical protein